jgi:hypothetical protein
MNKAKHLLTILIVLTLSGCASYSLVKANTEKTAKTITVMPTTAWTKTPAMIGKKVEVWTHDGILINRLMFIGGVDKDESIFKAPNKDTPMPAFQPEMLPDDIRLLVATSLKNLSGGEIKVDTNNLRPQEFADGFGFRFNIDFYTSEGLYIKGDAIASVKNEKLYAIVYMAAATHYYEKLKPEVEQVFTSARI